MWIQSLHRDRKQKWGPPRSNKTKCSNKNLVLKTLIQTYKKLVKEDKLVSKTSRRSDSRSRCSLEDQVLVGEAVLTYWPPVLVVMSPTAVKSKQTSPSSDKSIWVLNLTRYWPRLTLLSISIRLITIKWRTPSQKLTNSLTYFKINKGKAS